MSIAFEPQPGFPLSLDEVERLWQETIRLRDFADDQVNVKSVSEEEIQQLNNQYRHKDKPTNVLTFNYEGEHDVAICLPIAEQESKERGVPLRDYTALLLAHAFLHATGMDHEESAAEAEATQKTEQEILTRCGFSKISLE